VRRFVFAALLTIAAAACSEPPQKEIDQAQAALDAARAAGADKYSTAEYTAAASALQKAHESVTLRDYRQALNYAIDSRQRSQEAARLAADGRTRAQRAAEAALTGATARAAQLHQRIKTAEEARVGAKDLRTARQTLAEAQAQLQEARTAISGGNYEDATKSVTAVREKLDAAIERVEKIPRPKARSPRR
jgi:hypothetical protein